MATVIAWAFTPRAGREADLEAAHGPDGAWARRFARSPGFLGTKLLKAEGRYLTLDRGSAPGACDAFKAAHGGDYAALDRACEALTAEESRLGLFETVD